MAHGLMALAGALHTHVHAANSTAVDILAHGIAEAKAGCTERRVFNQGGLQRRTYAHGVAHPDDLFLGVHDVGGRNGIGANGLLHEVIARLPSLRRMEDREGNVSVRIMSALFHACIHSSIQTFIHSVVCIANMTAD